MRRSTRLAILMLLLSGLVAGGLWAKQTADRARDQRGRLIDRELDGLNKAFMAFRERVGGYPPSISNWNDAEERKVIFAFLARANPNLNLSTIEAAVRESTGLEISDLDCAESLVLWLGGFPQQKGNSFELPGWGAELVPPWISADEPFYNFDTVRLTDFDHDGWPEYQALQGDCDGLQPPYVYFDYRFYQYRPTHAYPQNPLATNSIMAAWGRCVPYQSKPGNWFNPDSFQVIFAGCDGQYGGSSTTTRVCATRAGITPADYDNRTNFVDGQLRIVIP